MNIEKKIGDIRRKLSLLCRKDKGLKVFGASRHQYKLNSILSEEDIQNFEDRFSITLPEEYRKFLLCIGNGGAGPYYGLETLEDSLYADLDYKHPNEFVNPSIEFPFTAPWNMKFEADEKDDTAYKDFEKEYFSEKWETGILRLCNYGCGVYLNLVVNGKEKGHIWVDDRGNDGGIYPDIFFDQEERTTFLDWYLLWLDRSINEISGGKIT